MAAAVVAESERSTGIKFSPFLGSIAGMNMSEKIKKNSEVVSYYL
jgi:hypothetical protein